MEGLKRADEQDYGPLAPNQLFLEKYEITALIGRGGHGAVYHARHLFLAHSVAIKIQQRQGGVKEEAFLRARAEAQILVQVQHPNVVKVFDAGITNDGLLYIVMEHLPGRSLREVLREHRKLTVDELLGFATQIAEGAAGAHAHDVIHRDIKPENVFVLPGNRGKLLDFGVAKFLNAGWITQKDTVLGTLLYMSPEQLQAEKITAQSDVYSLGVLMYEALSGRHPVQMLLHKSANPTMWDIARVVVMKMPPLLNEIDDSIPAYVAALIQRAISKEPRDRFASMAEFAHEMQKCHLAFRTEARARGETSVSRELAERPALARFAVAGAPSARTLLLGPETIPAPFIPMSATASVTRSARSVTAAPPIQSARAGGSGERQLPSVIVQPEPRFALLARSRALFNRAAWRGLRIGAVCGSLSGAVYISYLACGVLWEIKPRTAQAESAARVRLAPPSRQTSNVTAPSSAQLSSPAPIASAPASSATVAALSALPPVPSKLQPPPSSKPARPTRAKPFRPLVGETEVAQQMRLFEAEILHDRQVRLDAEKARRAAAAGAK